VHAYAPNLSRTSPPRSETGGTDPAARMGVAQARGDSYSPYLRLCPLATPDEWIFTSR
jgi:hypothetical protein